MDALQQIIVEDLDIPVQTRQSPRQIGRKDGGLTIALTVAGLSISAISSFISALSYWKSTRPRYSISIISDGAEIKIDNIAAEYMEQLAKKLAMHNDDARAEVLISRPP